MTRAVEDFDDEPLARLASRQDFNQRVEAAVRKARAQGSRHVLIRVELGPGSGSALPGVVTVLASLLRESDSMTRLDHEGIALLMEDCDLAYGLRVARILRALLRLGEGAGGIGQPPQLSIGVVEIDGRSEDAEELRKRAAEACGAAQRRGVNRIQVHEPGQER